VSLSAVEAMIAISLEIWAIMHVEHLSHLSGLGHRIHSLERIARKRVVGFDLSKAGARRLLVRGDRRVASGIAEAIFGVLHIEDRIEAEAV
jgi:hypothetical protein